MSVDVRPNTIIGALPIQRDVETRVGKVVSAGGGVADVVPVSSQAVVRVFLVGSGTPNQGDMIVYQKIGNRRVALSSGVAHATTSGSSSGGSSTTTIQAPTTFTAITGVLADEQAPQFLKTDGSRALTNDLSVNEGVLIDGVDLSELQADFTGHNHDHGSLTDLGADDHPQYFNVARHDTFTAHGDTVVSHSLIAGLDQDDHPQYLTQTRGDARYVELAGDTLTGTLVTQSMRPVLSDTYDLGTTSALYRKAYMSELQALIFARQTVTLLGSLFVVPKGSGALPAAIEDTATQIDFGVPLSSGDIVLLRDVLKVEYILIGEQVEAGEPSVPVPNTYNVTRDLDGTGAQDWPAEAVFEVRGRPGDGRIVFDATDAPKISIIEQGLTYNTQTTTLQLGSLEGIVDGDFGGALADTGLYATGNVYVRGNIVAASGSAGMDSGGIWINAGPSSANWLNFRTGQAFRNMYVSAQAAENAEIAVGAVSDGHAEVKLRAQDDMETGGNPAQVRVISKDGDAWVEIQGKPFTGVVIGAGEPDSAAGSPPLSMLHVEGAGYMERLNIGVFPNTLAPTPAGAGQIRAYGEIFAYGKEKGLQSQIDDWTVVQATGEADLISNFSDVPGLTYAATATSNEYWRISASVTFRYDEGVGACQADDPLQMILTVNGTEWSTDTNTRPLVYAAVVTGSAQGGTALSYEWPAVPVDGGVATTAKIRVRNSLGSRGKQKRYGCSMRVWRVGRADAPLPLLAKPSTPVMNAISNADGDGDYQVSWSPATNITHYELQEDDNSLFVSPTTTEPDDADEFVNVTDKPDGTYWYRIRGINENAFGTREGDWSNIQAVTVSPASPDYWLGVVLDQGGYGTIPGTHGVDYTYPQAATYNYYQTKGFSGVRLGFRLERLFPALTGDSGTAVTSIAIDAAELQRLKDQVALAKARGMQVILTPLNLGRYGASDIGVSPFTYDAFVNCWRRLAYEFNGESAIYAYSLMHAPRQSNGSWHSVIQPTITGIRGQDTSTLILVPGERYAVGENYPNFVAASLDTISDPNDNWAFEAQQHWDTNSTYSGGSYDAQYAGTVYENDPRALAQAKIGAFLGWLDDFNTRTSQSIGAFYTAISAPDNDSGYTSTSQAGYGPEDAPGNKWLVALDEALKILKTRGYGFTFWFGGPGSSTDTRNLDPKDNYVTDRPQMSVILGINPPDTPPPTEPVLNAISGAGDGDFQVTWSAVQGATLYELERDTSNTFPAPTEVYSDTATTYNEENLSQGTYYYRVRATVAGVPSDWSNTESATVDAPPSSSTPLNGLNFSLHTFGLNMPGTYGNDYADHWELEFQYWAAKGAKSIRYGADWTRLQYPQMASLNETFWVNRLRPFLNRCRQYGFKVLLDCCHNYARYAGTLIGSGWGATEFADYWGKVSARIVAEGYDDLLIGEGAGYDLMNEPHDTDPGGTERWTASVVQAAINAIRANDTSAYIHVPIHNWSHAYTAATDTGTLYDSLTDAQQKLVFHFHEYWWNIWGEGTPNSRKRRTYYTRYYDTAGCNDANACYINPFTFAIDWPQYASSPRDLAHHYLDPFYTWFEAFKTRTGKTWFKTHCGEFSVPGNNVGGNATVAQLYGLNNNPWLQVADEICQIFEEKGTTWHWYSSCRTDWSTAATNILPRNSGFNSPTNGVDYPQTEILVQYW